jgi:hypothetical protein
MNLGNHLILLLLCFDLVFIGWGMSLLKGTIQPADLNPFLVSLVVFLLGEAAIALGGFFVWAIRLFGPHNPRGMP